jgi:hypothetical protein
MGRARQGGNYFPFILARFQWPNDEPPTVCVVYDGLEDRDEQMNDVMVREYAKKVMARDVDMRMKLTDNNPYALYIGFLPEFEENGRVKPYLVEEHLIGTNQLIVPVLITTSKMIW